MTADRRLDRQVLGRVVLPSVLLLFLAMLQWPGLERLGVIETGRRFPPPIDSGQMLLLIGCALGQAPALWIWRRVGTSSLLSLAVTLGGLCAAIASLSRGPDLYLVLRLLQGVAEAGMLTAVLLALAASSPQRRWGLASALVLAAAPAALALTPLVARMLEPAAPAAIEAWRWPMFAVGVVTATAGIYATFIHWPALYLDVEAVMELNLVRKAETRSAARASLVTSAAGDLRTYLWAAGALALSLAIGGLGLIGDPDDFRRGSVSPDLLPLLWGTMAAGMLASGVSSDRFGARYRHVGLTALLAALALAAGTPPEVGAGLRLGLLFVCAGALGGAVGAFWPVVLRRLESQARPAGVAIVAAAGFLGLALSQILNGWNWFRGGLALQDLLLANLLVMAAAMMMCAASYDRRLDLTGGLKG